MSTTTVAKTEQQPLAQAPQKTLTIRDHLESPAFVEQIRKVLPKHITPDRMIRVACTAMTKNPKLYDCTEGSLLSSMLTLSAVGLEPDGRLAHLVPYGNVCTPIIDWKGLAQTAFWSGEVATQGAEIIYEGDKFDYSCGQVLDHIPWWLRRDKDKPKTQGAAMGAYATATMKDGTKQSVVMSADQILAIKARSKSKDKGPWVTDEMEMWKKTAYRRLSKWLPIANERFAKALEADDETDGIRKVEGEAVSIDQFKGLPSTPMAVQEPAAVATPEVVKTADALPDLINAKLRELDITWTQFQTMLVIQDEKVTPQQANTIKEIIDVPVKVLEWYAGKDRQCTQLTESVQKFLKGELI